MEKHRTCEVCKTWRGVSRYMLVWLCVKCAFSVRGRALVSASMNRLFNPNKEKMKW